MKPTTCAFLIIDDDKDFCQLLETMLDSSKFSTQSVHTLAQAEPALQRTHPQIVLLDNHLPDGRGLDFIRNIREFDPAIRIIMITADANSNIAVTSLERGVNHFIAKPFSFKSIVDKLENMLEEISAG
ncbi:MAG: response regulator [Chitinophagaceae bacterium]|nr:MAG: response regulator [Chitinophagaceae bacterium]